MYRLIMILLMIMGGTVSGLTFESKLDCIECHTDRSGKQVKPETAPPASCSSCHTDVKHREPNTSSTFCGDCHTHWSHNSKYLNSHYRSKWIESRANPHDNDYMCIACHNEGDSNSTFPLFHSNIDQVCESCHRKEAVNLKAHSSGFAYVPSQSTKIPKQFPLQEGRVTCNTCHQFQCNDATGHQITRNKFLRGPYKKREQFCITCHQPEQYQRHNPHIQFDADNRLVKENCIVCHIKMPDLNKTPDPKTAELKGGQNAVCQGCHMFKDSHPTGTDHIRPIPERLRDYVDQNIAKSNVPFPLGKDYQILCITCHTPHQYELMPKHSKEKSRNRTRYLSGYDLCIMCHIK